MTARRARSEDSPGSIGPHSLVACAVLLEGIGITTKADINVTGVTAVARGGRYRHEGRRICILVIRTVMHHMQARETFQDPLRHTAAAAASRADVEIIDAGTRLDHRKAQQMKQRFKQLAAEGRLRHIVDLTRIDNLDSGGLAGLVSTLRAVRDSGGSIQLVVTSNRVTQILELTALTRLFRVHPSMKDALASV